MDPNNFFFFVLPLAIIIAVLVIVVFYLSRKNEETKYEKEIKQFRKLLIKGKINRKTFLYMRDNLKAEDLFTGESKRLDELLNHQKIDQLTYSRMKTAQQMTYNEKIVKREENTTTTNLTSKKKNMKLSIY